MVSKLFWIALIFSLFLNGLEAGAGVLACVLTPQQIEIRQESCRQMMKLQDCESFQPTEYLRTCDRDEVTTIWPNDPVTMLATCRRGAIDATSEFFTWVDESLTQASQSIHAKNEMLAACDLACKRKMSAGISEFDKMPDANLEKLSAVYVENKVGIVRNEMARFEQLEKARKYDPIRDPRVLNSLALRSSQSPEVTSLNLQKNAKSLWALATAAADKEFKRTQCYKPEFYPEMICYGLFTVIDPTVAAGLVIKSPRLAALLAKSFSKGSEAHRIGFAQKAKNGISRISVEREIFIEKNLNRTFATVEQNEKWIATVEKPKPGTVVLDVENSVMQKLNNTTKDKNLVTSITNRHKEILNDKVSALEKKYAGQVQFVPYSDFKSQRWAIEPIPPATAVPAELRAELSQAFEAANKNFESHLQLNGIIRETDEARLWFRAGIGETADQASLAARASRGFKANELRGFGDAAVQDNMTAFVHWAELKRVEIEKEFAGTKLLDKAGSPGSLPTETVFDAIRKTSDNDGLRDVLTKKFGGNTLIEQNKFRETLTDTKMAHLREYSELVDQFAPSLRTAERKVASIQDAEWGGLTADFAGMGAKNTRATAQALVGSKDLSQAVSLARQSEKAVTAEFNKAKEEFENIVAKYTKETVASGDDFAAVARIPISQEQKQKMLSEVATLKNPSGQRISFIGEGVPSADRNKLAAHGEAIEKELRSKLDGVIPAEKLKQLVFATDMQTKNLGQGSVGLIIGESSKAGLTASERKQIKDLFQKAIKDFNKTPDSEIGEKFYKAN